MGLFSWCVIVVTIVIGVAFAIVNSEPVIIHYYVGQQECPLSLLLVGFLVLGLVIGWLSALPKLLKLKFQNLKQRRY